MPYASAQRMAGMVIRRNACHVVAPSVHAACSCSTPISSQHRLDRAHDQRQRDEDGREHHPGDREDDVEAAVGQPAADRRERAVHQDQGEPDDDRRHGQRQVDERVEHPLAPELVPGQQDRGADAEHGVRDDRDDGDRRGSA